MADQTSPVSETPVAWVCELAHAIDENRQYCDWRDHLSFVKPMVPEAAIRNLRPLYFDHAQTPAHEALLAAREYIGEDNNPRSNRVLQKIALALTATAAPAKSSQQWQPIETAPKDATDVLVVVNGYVGEAYFNMQDDGWWWANTDPHDFDPSHAIYPTHWMLLPEPPALSDSSTDREVEWCQPRDCGKPTPRKFMIYFDDPDQGIMVFDNEAEARETFEKKNTAWNCYLFGTLPVSSPTQNTEG